MLCSARVLWNKVRLLSEEALVLTNSPPYAFNYFKDFLFYANNYCLIQMDCLNNYAITKTIVMDNQFHGDFLKFITFEDMCYILCDNTYIITKPKGYKLLRIFVKMGLSLFRAFFD